MPSGPLWLHEKWKTDGAAVEFLESHGYTLRDDFCWERPDSGKPPTDEEQEALWYLMAEWDYGGLRDEQ